MEVCSLFASTKYQYGPACVVAARLESPNNPKSALIYYPVGSGKTLSSLHAARLFLDHYDDGHVHVLTTKSNIETSWKENIRKYSDSEKRSLEIDVQNIDRWFSEEKLPHYTRLIRLMTAASSNNRCVYMNIPWRMLLNDAKHVLTRKDWLSFRRVPVEENLSFLDACVPKGNYMLIVDECQQYLNHTSHQLLVAALCRHSSSTLLLSATPLNAANQQSGLQRMLSSHSLQTRILYVPPQPGMVEVVERYMGAKMTAKETQKYRSNKKDDAYLTKGRQLCNTESKWSRMLKYISNKTVVYSFFREFGVDGFFQYILAHGKKAKSKTSTYLTFQHQESKIHVKVFRGADDVRWFNRISTKNKMLLLTSKAQLGISLMGVQTFHIMEPQWTYSSEAQAVGRVTRMGSHAQGDSVTVFHWISTTVQYESSDEIVHRSMETKKRSTDRVLAVYQKTGADYLEQLLSKFRIYSI